MTPNHGDGCSPAFGSRACDWAKACGCHWDCDAPLFLDLSGKHPQLRIWAEAEKGRQDRKLPLTPDFAEWLLHTPEAQRRNRVFPILTRHSPRLMLPNEEGRVISAIGKKAGVIVNKDAGKYASAHDLRRSFGTRWAKRVMPAVLQKLMRHATIETTLRYYADLDADELAEDLWHEYSLHHEVPTARCPTSPPDRPL
jgi:integrase